MNVLRMCLNWKVIAALGVVGVTVWAVRPDLIGSLIPTLILLACPLSMVLMAFAMRGDRSSGEGAGEAAGATQTKDRVAELRERLERARAEEAVIASELSRLEDEGASSDGSTSDTTPAEPQVAPPLSREDG